MYELYLMDADDTLLDFRAAEAAAFKQTFVDLGLSSDEGMYRRYRKINQDLWAMLERGEIEKGMLLLRRFEQLALEFSLPETPARLNEAFLQRLSEHGDTVEGAGEVLRALSQRAEIAIVTNGVAWAQRQKLARSGLMEFVKWLIISEEAGAEKPCSDFFEAAMRICARTEKRGVLVVGDSPQADIGGARAFGLDSCLFDPEARYPDCESTFWIRSLRELLTL